MTTQIASTTITEPVVPDAIKLSPGETLLWAARGKGFQIYEWLPKKDEPNQYEWVHTPEADLFDIDGNKIGSHYAGPTWESNDGSKVICVIERHADSKDANAAPWLFLSVKTHEGKGAFSPVTSIRRMNTVGGGEPPDGKPGQVVRVPYTATYYFYGSKP